MDLTKSTGAKIQLIREQKGIKQTFLAKELSLSVQTLSAIENGKCDITLSKLEQISKLLSVSLIDLIGDGVYTDPLADRKKVLEETTHRVIELYDAFCQKHARELHYQDQSTTIIEMQHRIIKLLNERVEMQVS